jgi:hypothetical protein
MFSLTGFSPGFTLHLRWYMESGAVNMIDVQGQSANRWNSGSPFQIAA